MKLKNVGNFSAHGAKGSLGKLDSMGQGLGSSRTRVDIDTGHPAQHPLGRLSKTPELGSSADSGRNQPEPLFGF